MFSRPTVFIVGAGANTELGLPMGKNLMQQISANLAYTFDMGVSIKTGDRKIFGALERIAADQGTRDLNPWIRAARAISEGMHQAISIDNYLHTHAHDETITTVGKLAIASQILAAEDNSHFTHNLMDLVEPKSAADSWLIPFFQMLSEGVQHTNLERIFDNVSIITFNYDRCIEHYLLGALVSYFRIEISEAIALMSRLKIEHVYGQVGQLEWQRHNGAVPFGKDCHPDQLVEVSKQIQTFTEGVADVGLITRMQQLIEEAKVVVFLGFAYGELNMKLLTVAGKPQRALVFGTSYMVSAPNIRIIENDVVEAFARGTRGVYFEGVMSKDILGTYWHPILRG